jgi:hypothetical protein
LYLKDQKICIDLGKWNRHVDANLESGEVSDLKVHGSCLRSKTPTIEQTAGVQTSKEMPTLDSSGSSSPNEGINVDFKAISSIGS